MDVSEGFICGLIYFQVKLMCESVFGPSCLFLSGKHGVGRIDIVENRFIGMKSRGKELKIILILICLGYDIFFFVTFFYL